MADQEQRPRPGVEQVLEDGEHIGVHVVARLVEDQDVRLAQQHEHELQAALLASRELLDARQLLAGFEPEALEQLRGGVLLAVDRIALPDRAEHLAHRLPAVGHQLVEPLGQDGEPDGLSDLNRARRRRDATVYDAQQRRLAGAVGTQDAIAVPWSDDPAHVVEDRLVAPPLGHALELDDELAQAAHRQHVELDVVAQGRHVGDQRLGRLDAKLGLGAARLRPAGQPGELLAQDVLAALLGCARLAVALDALLDVGRISALEGVDDTVVHLPHGEADLVEEPAVVRDDEERPLPSRPAGLEMVGQPGYGAHVEVVGRLVEGEDVPVADKQPRQVDAAALPARKRPDLRLPGDVAQQRGDHRADAGVARPLMLGGVAHDAVAHGVPVPQPVLLAQDADPRAPAHRDAAVVRLEQARHDREQRRLAVAVLAHDPDAVALGQAEAHARQHLPGRVFDMDVFATDEHSHRTTCLSTERRANGARRASTGWR